jgi:hypothetical protein
MPRRRTRQPARPGRKLHVSASGALERGVPKRWVKFVVGIFLLFPAAVLTQTFFTAFAEATVEGGFWKTEAFWFFSLGVVLWCVAFLGLPRPLWLYVFGHELTHALWVLLMGGKVRDFRVTATGGYILADRTNTWIALAPYFFPLYSVLAVVVFGVAGLIWDMQPYERWLYAVVGVTWGFHLTFTCVMVARGQPDLHYGGTFFSVVLIYLLNLVIISGALVATCAQVGFRDFLAGLAKNAMDLTVALTMGVNHLLR